MMSNQLPQDGVMWIEGNPYPCNASYSDDGWFMVQIRYTRWGTDHYYACGRGRSGRVALKFAMQALRKALK